MILFLLLTTMVQFGSHNSEISIQEKIC